MRRLCAPILRDKLWFAASYRRWRVDRLEANRFNRDGTQALNEMLISNYTGSTTVQVTPKNRISGYFEYSDKIRPHRGDPTSTYQFVNTEATVNETNAGPATTIKWTSTPRSNFLLEAGLAATWWAYRTRYQADAAADGLPRNDLALSLLTGASATVLDRVPRRLSPSIVASWLPSWKGTHNIRFGYQYTNFHTPYGQWTAGADLVARYNNGVPVSVEVYNTPVNTDTSVILQGLFAQESWSIGRFTANVGVRYDYLRGRLNEEQAAAGRFVPARNFAAIDNVPLWKVVVPTPGVRLGRVRRRQDGAQSERQQVCTNGRFGPSTRAQPNALEQ